MLKRNEINKIAKKFGWDYIQAEDAVNDIIDYSSIIDCEEFIRVCIKAKDYDLRINNTNFFLINNIKGDLVDIICNLMSIDLSFYVLALYNIYDFLRSNRYEIRGFPASYETSPLFYHSRFLILLKFDSKSDMYVPEDNEGCIPSQLTYNFLDGLIRDRLKLYSSESVYSDNTFQVLKDVLARVGFRAFNIQLFLQIVTDVSYYPHLPEIKERLKELYEAIPTPTKTRVENKKIRDWFIYVLVEKYKEKGYTQEKSFEIVGKEFYQERNSIHQRYYERKREASARNLLLKDVINENQLYIPLKDFLAKKLS